MPDGVRGHLFDNKSPLLLRKYPKFLHINKCGRSRAHPVFGRLDFRLRSKTHDNVLLAATETQAKQLCDVAFFATHIENASSAFYQQDPLLLISVLT